MSLVSSDIDYMIATNVKIGSKIKKWDTEWLKNEVTFLEKEKPIICEVSCSGNGEFNISLTHDVRLTLVGDES